LLSASVPARGPQAGPKPGVRAEFKDYWTFCEAIDTEMRLSGRLQIDDRAISDRSQRLFGWNDRQRHLSVHDLRDAANRFALDLCDWELDYFGRMPKASATCNVEDVLDFYHGLRHQISSAPADTLFLSLGHGSGWHKMTIGLLLEKRMAKEQFARL